MLMSGEARDKKGGATIGYADFIRDTNETP
jgi:hypothetical protein